MSKRVVERGERKRREPFVPYEERQNWGCNDADNQPVPLIPEAMEMSGPVALPQPGFVLMSVAYVITLKLY